MHSLVTEPDHLIYTKDIFLGSCELAAHTIEFLLVLVIKHIDIKIPHEA